VTYVRKVRTASGAVAVQVVRKHRGRREIVAHVGSARTDGELGVLLERARRLSQGDQGMLDLDVLERASQVADVADWRSGQLPAPLRKANGLTPPLSRKSRFTGQDRVRDGDDRVVADVPGAAVGGGDGVHRSVVVEDRQRHLRFRAGSEPGAVRDRRYRFGERLTFTQGVAAQPFPFRPHEQRPAGADLDIPRARGHPSLRPV
jgi:hypothetical protein